MNRILSEYLSSKKKARRLQNTKEKNHSKWLEIVVIFLPTFIKNLKSEFCVFHTRVSLKLLPAVWSAAIIFELNII